MKRIFTRTMSWVLILSMILGSNTMMAFAEELGDIVVSESIEEVPETIEVSLPEPEPDPVEEIIELPVEVPTEVPTGVPTEVPTEVAPEESTEVPIAEPTEVVTEEPTSELIEVPTELPIDEPTEVAAPTEIPTEISTSRADVVTDETPTEEPVIETPAPMFEEGYFLVYGNTTVYKTINGEEAGRFLADSYVYATVQHRVDNLSDDWLKVVFDTDVNRNDGKSLNEGFVKGNQGYTLEQNEADELNNRASWELNVRSYRGVFLPNTQYEEYAVKMIPTEVPTAEAEDAADLQETQTTMEPEEQGSDDENVQTESDEQAIVIQIHEGGQDETSDEETISSEETDKVEETAETEESQEGEQLDEQEISQEGEQVDEQETSQEEKEITEAEKVSAFDKGFVRVSANTAVYASVDDETEFGTIDEEVVIYALEVIRREDESILWMHVNFKTTTDKDIDGFISGEKATVIEGEAEASSVAFSAKTIEEEVQQSLVNHFIIVMSGTVVYSLDDETEVLGTFTDDSYVYVIEDHTDFLKISFQIENGETVEGYIASSDYVVTDETEIPAAKFEKTAVEITKGYVRLSAGTVVFTTAELTDELGTVDTEAIVYAEVVECEDETVKAYKVLFDTADGSSYEGYVTAESLAFLTEDEVNAVEGREYNRFLIPVVAFSTKVNGLTDGLWVYDVVNDYARVLGYLDYEVTSLSIPDQLGGYYVNAIGEKAFQKNEALQSLYVQGNVISIADDAFASKNVTLSGYNGTKVLAYAKAHEMPSENRTNLDGAVLQDHVVDYSYASSERYDYSGEFAIRMNAVEAANLSVGSIFYIPTVYGKLMRIYKVESISVNADSATIYVSEAEAEEALVHLAINDELVPDWSGAIWAEGVEVVQEKVQASDSFSDKIVVNYSKTLGQKKINDEKVASLKLNGSAEIGLTGTIGVDVDFWIPFVQDLSLNSFDIKVDIDGRVSGGISLGADNDDYAESSFKRIASNAKNQPELLKKVTNALREKAKYDIYLGAIPLDGKNRKTSVYVGIYLRVAVSGKIELVSKLHGTLIQVSYKKGSGWSKTHSVQWNPLSISAAVDIDFGLAAIAEAKCWGIGSVAKIEAFAGLNASAEMNMDILQSLAADYTTAGGAGGSGAIYQNFIKCADIKINIKVEASFATDLEWLQEIIDKNTKWTKMHKSKWTILELKWPIKSWHLEAPGLDFIHWKSVGSCTNSFVTVDFYTGTGEKLNTLKIQNNTVLGTKNEPSTTADPDKRYVLKNVIGDLEGWYIYEGCSGPTEYANGVGSKRKWDFANDKVSGNMTLYAEWRSGTSYDVIYKPNFTSKDPAKPVPNDITQQALEGALLTNPGQMKRDEYRFKGWFTDSAATNEWKFDSDTVKQDKLTNGKLILYAGWEYESGYDPNAVETDTHGRMSFNGHSYTHIMEYKSYSEAEADAKRQGGYLCTINSAEEQVFLAKYMYDDCAQDYLWLGMTSNDGWNYWKTGEAVTYSNWNAAPSSSADQFNAAIIRTSGKWTTLSNTQTAHYVIEWGTPAIDPNYNKTVKSDLTFTPNSDGKTATVTGIQSGGLFVDKSVIAIPSVSPDGLQVTGIAAAAFKGNRKLEQISIPNSVTYIGNGAFENCTKLKTVTIPSYVTTIGTNVFKGCTALENVVWSTGLTTIPESTFEGCSKLVTISNIGNITSIGNNAFRNNTAMNSFPFPTKLTTIGQYAFYSDSALREIVLPDYVTAVNQYAFYGCTSAYKISLPDSVSSIGYYAFYNCKSASDIYLPATITKNGINNSAFSSVSGTFHVYKNTGADEWCIDNGKKVEYLGATQKIKFSAGEGSAYEPTAKDGDMLTEIYVEVGKRVTEPTVEREGMVIEGWYLEPEFITKWDFATDKVPDHSITLYAKWVTVSNVFTYDIVNGTARINGYTGSTELVLIPDVFDGYTVTHILEGAFTGDTIQEIVIPASVSSIASGAFDCSNLEKITLRSDKYFSVHDDGVLYLKSGKQLIYAPQGIMYTEYTVPGTVTSIRNYAFRGHNELDKIFIPDTVTAIGNGTFDGNHTVTIYGSVNTCAAKTFANSNLLPYNMYIVRYAYEDGTLYTASHQAGQLIEDYFEPMADFFSYGGWFKDSQTTQEWNFASDLMPQSDLTLYLKWDSLFDIAVNGNTINITGYRGTATDIIIPAEISGKTVVGIDSGAFILSNATSIQVPDSVTTIEESAFPTTATIISSADSAARTYAINHSLKYKNITYTIHFEVDGGSQVKDMSVVPGKTVSLPTPIRSNYYFYGWYTDTTYMESVRWTDETEMPTNNVTLYACWRSATTGVTNDFAYNLLSDGTIEITGYSGTKTVLSVPETINGYTVTRIGDFAFESNDTILSITLPKEITSIGKYAFSESSVRTVKGANSLAEIEEGAFRGATSLTSIALTNNLRTIGDFAFQRCGSLTSITLPKGTVSVGVRAFYDCEFLDTVNVTTTLSYLGREAFAECPRLKSVSVPTSLVNVAKDAFDPAVTISYKTSTAISFMKFDIIGNTIDVTWNKVQNASNYAIESKRSTNKTYQRKIETSETKTSFALGAYGVSYDVKVVALDSNGEVISESLPVVAYLSRLGTPQIESVSQLNATTATMILAGVNGVDGYEVERAYSLDDNFTLLKSVDTTTFRNTGLMKGFEYYYRVRAYTEGADGERTYSRYSEVYHFTMPSKYVVAPANVTVRQTSINAAKISWDPVDDAEGYIVYRSINGGAYKQLRQTIDTYTTNTALPKGVFSYKVSAFFTENGVQIFSKESEAAQLTVQDIATPEITDIKQLTATGVTLSWTVVKGASGYKLYKSSSANGPFAWAKNIGETTTTTYSASMSSGNTYYFVVRAYVNNDDGSISYSNDSPVVSINFSSVAQAGGLTVSQTAGSKAKLMWTALSGIEGYEIWMSAVNNRNYELVGTTDARVYNVDNLNDGVTYYFKVRGYSGTGSEKILGLYSDEASVSMLGAPVLQVAEQNGTASAQLIWTKVNSADGYEVWRKMGNEDYKLAKTVTVNSATVFSLSVGTSYSFKVRAYKLDENNQKNYGFDSNVMSAYIIGTTKITSLTRSGGAAVTLTWDKAEGATGYYLYRSDTSNGIYTRIKATTDLTVSNTGLTKGSIYYFKIVPYRTVNGVNVEGRPTAVRGIRLLEKPVINTIEQTAGTTLTLTWSEVPMATSYRIYRSETANGEFTYLKKVTGETTATSINLTQDKWYYYTVEAGIDEDGTTYYSQQSVAKGAYVTSLAKPDISSIVQTTNGATTITWKKVTGANGYELLRSTDQNGVYSSVKMLTANSYSNSGLTEGTTYYYKVRPYKTVNGTKAFGLSSNVVGALMMPAVKITALDRTANKRVDLFWNAIESATAYNVYRSSTKDGTYSLLKTTSDTTAYNTALTLNTSYYYKVAAVVNNGVVNNVGPLSTASGITLADIGAASISSVKQTKSAAVEISWKAVTNASGYELSMAKEGDTTFTWVKNITSGATLSTGTSANLVDGQTYQYRIRAFVAVDGTKQYGAYSTPVSITLMNAPSLESLYQTASNRVEMMWNASNGATGYEVYRKVGTGSYRKLKDVTELSVYNTALTVGTKYIYKIRAYRTENGVTSYSGYSNEMAITPIRYSTGGYPESAHDYTNNMNESWSYSIEGAQALKVTFTEETAFENNYDKLYITDKNGNAVGNSYWTGTQLASKTIIVPGNTINLRMTSDGSVVRYGFAIESIVPAGQ